MKTDIPADILAELLTFAAHGIKTDSIFPSRELVDTFYDLVHKLPDSAFNITYLRECKFACLDDEDYPLTWDDDDDEYY